MRRELKAVRTAVVMKRRGQTESHEERIESFSFFCDFLYGYILNLMRRELKGVAGDNEDRQRRVRLRIS